MVARIVAILGALAILALFAFAADDERRNGDIGCRPHCADVQP